MTDISSDVIIKALRARHSDCVFVSECKDGPTQSGPGHLRMDAWVMEKSWSHPRTIAYEVKVSRSDFLQDNKYHAYLNYCNEFYFAAPKGLISKDELPPDVGLVELIGGIRLRTVKKAPYRKLAIPENVYRYILMCRTKINGDTSENVWTKSGAADEWRAWLAEKSEHRNLGHMVARSIRERVDKVESENHMLRRANESYAGLKKFLVERNLMDADSNYCNEWSARRRLDAANTIFPEDVEQRIKKASEDLSVLFFSIKTYKENLEKEICKSNS